MTSVHPASMDSPTSIMRWKNGGISTSRSHDPSSLHDATTCKHPSAPKVPYRFRVGILANQDHCIVRLTLQTLLEDGIVPVFVVEDEGTQKLRDKTAWYNEVYERKRGKLPSVADLLAPYKSSVQHKVVKNINHEECIDFMRDFPVDVLVLANTRIVKPQVLSVPGVTTLNAHAAFLPNHDPAHACKSRGGYIRGAMPFIMAVNRNEPCGVTLHHAVKDLDAGKIVDSMSVDVHRGDMTEDIMVEVVEVTAKLWLRGLSNWDGTDGGVSQDVSLLLEENKVPVKGLTGDDLTNAMKSGDEILSSGSYKWYV